MATLSRTVPLNIPAFSASLDEGDTLYFKLHLTSSRENVGQIPAITFTASLSSPGKLIVTPVAISTGYVSIPCPYLATGSSVGLTVGALTNEITFGTRISNLYGDDYQFEPNPENGISSSLYQNYGDTRFTFKASQMDVVVMQLSDSTYFIATVDRVYRDSALRVRLVLDRYLSQLVINNINSNTFLKFLLIKRYANEQNIIVEFRKAPGATSYGFVIPETITQEVLDRINNIQSTVQTQLLSTEVTSTFPIIS